MNRTNIYLEGRQTAALDRLASDEGVSRAEVIRRLLDRALFGADEDIAADLAAINGSFGVMGDGDLDLGSLDRADGERSQHLEDLWNRGRRGVREQ